MVSETWYLKCGLQCSAPPSISVTSNLDDGPSVFEGLNSKRKSGLFRMEAGGLTTKKDEVVPPH
jgi:hypothetical protein